MTNKRSITLGFWDEHSLIISLCNVISISTHIIAYYIITGIIVNRNNNSVTGFWVLCMFTHLWETLHFLCKACSLFLILFHRLIWRDYQLTLILFESNALCQGRHYGSLDWVASFRDWLVGSCLKINKLHNHRMKLGSLIRNAA